MANSFGNLMARHAIYHGSLLGPAVPTHCHICKRAKVTNPILKTLDDELYEMRAAYNYAKQEVFRKFYSEVKLQLPAKLLAEAGTLRNLLAMVNVEFKNV